MKSTRLWIILTLLLGACSHAATEGQETPVAEVPELASPSAPKPVVAPGDYKKTLTVGTDLRSYILHVPTHYDGSKPLPLVFIFHGAGGTAANMVKLTGMSEKGDQEGFFVAYLQGTNNIDGRTGWNSALMPEEARTVDDIGFVHNLTQVLATDLNLDTQRIYAAGFSNGGFMTHHLGSELSDVLAGVAAVAGTVGTSFDDGATFQMIPAAQAPMPIVMIHGKQDHNIPYDGGPGVHEGFQVKSVSAAVNFWTTADGCTGTPEQQTSADGNVISVDYNACTKGSEVELFTILNGGHEWPRTDTQTHFSATDAIWEFFSRHSKAKLMTAQEAQLTFQAASFKDLSYAAVSSTEKLDLYMPAGNGPYPVVVYIHGGGWRSGDKIQPFNNGIVARLLEDGYAVASVNYRLSGEAVFPAAIQDVKAAVRWLRANAQQYRLDPDRFATWGDSAGGHLSALLGTSCGVTDLEGADLGNAGQSSCIQAVVDWYGPTDFLVGDQQFIDAGSNCPAIHDLPHSGESEFMGFPIQDQPNKVKKANPITYVSAEDPPFFIQHGTADCTVPPEQSQIFYDALAPAIGTENVSLKFFDGWKHGDAKFRSAENLSAVVQFLNQRLK